MAIQKNYVLLNDSLSLNALNEMTNKVILKLQYKF